MEKEFNDRRKNTITHNWQRILLLGFGMGFILYLIIGFLIIPLIGRWLISDYIETDLNRPGKIGSVGFNPLTFELSIDDFYLYEADSSVFISWKEVSVNLNVLLLINGIIEIDTMAIYGAGVNIIRNPDSTFNFDNIPGELLQLAAIFTRKEDPWELRLNRIGVHNTTAVFEDHMFAPHFVYGIEDIRFQLRDLHLFSPDTAAWKVNLKMAGGGTADASGILPTDGIRSDFSLRLSGISFKPFQPILSRFTHLRIDGGTLDADRPVD